MFGNRYFVTMSKMEVLPMANLYNTIEELAANNGVSIFKMCKDIGIRQSVISDLKHGRQSGISAKNLDKIAAYFGVSVSYLLGTETKKDQPDDGLVNGDPELTEYLQELQSRPEMKMLFHAFKSATKEQIEAIVMAWEVRNNIKGE